VHAASPEAIAPIQQACEENTRSQELKYRLVLTKQFSFGLPASILSDSCLQIADDVLENVLSGSTLTTCPIDDDTLVFKNISAWLGLLKNSQSIEALLTDLPTQLVYFTCLTLGLLQSRQCLAVSGLRTSQPWTSACLRHCLNAIRSFSDKTSNSFAEHMLKVVFVNYLQDPLDQDYVRQLLATLTANNHQILIRSEEFIETLQQLWDTSDGVSSNRLLFWLG